MSKRGQKDVSHFWTSCYKKALLLIWRKMEVSEKKRGGRLFLSYVWVCVSASCPSPTQVYRQSPFKNCAQNVWNPNEYEFKPPVVIVVPLMYAALRPINRASLSKKKIKISNLSPKKDISKLFFPKKNLSYLSRKKSFLKKS